MMDLSPKSRSKLMVELGLPSQYILGCSLPGWNCRSKRLEGRMGMVCTKAMTNVNPNVSSESSKAQCPMQILLDRCLIQHTGDWDPVKLLHSGDC
jgi:hypothetical protein